MTGEEPAAVHRAEQGEQLTRLLQRITAHANEATETHAALGRAAEIIADAMGWTAVDAIVLEAGGTDPHDGSNRHGQRDAIPVDDRMVELHGADVAELVEQVVETGGPIETPDGSDHVAFPVTTQEAVVAVLVFLVDPATETEQDLLETMASLGRQLGVLVERNAARSRLESLNRELERSNRELERFAYVASHDLQEPLRKIVGFTELLELRHRDQLADEAREFLDIVVDGAKRMRRLIDDLLAYSRAGRRDSPRGAVPLSQVVEAAVSDLQAAIQDAGADVTVDELPTVHGNEDGLRGLFVNLIGNAIKYHSESPKVHISSARERDGWWRISVEDNGIGIAPEHHERIFDVFQRLHVADRYGGTGIGLALSRQVAEQHGGRIWVDSQPGEGSTFHVTLPPSTDVDRQEPRG